MSSACGMLPLTFDVVVYFVVVLYMYLTYLYGSIHSRVSHISLYIIKLYCHIQRDELECSLALTHTVPTGIYAIKLIWQINIRYRYKIYIVHNLFFKMFFNIINK